ncbi:transketolase [Oceanithermus sp.]|uniref:transketolase n=1 Tax=Oceanithermus sp. TaxID=2268145 RepID=UPI00257BE64A|nr:transketolase [Oceanithermus sp.]
MSWPQEAKRVADGIRRRVTAFTLKNGGGYLSQACSSAEILATLYTRVMNLGPSVAPPVPPPFGGVPGKNPDYTTGAGYNGPHEPERDRFFISPVHYALVLYATLVETGRMAEEGLEMFNQDGGTVEMIGAEHSPGHELMAGSLGQALSQVIGVALGRRRKGEPGRNFVFMSDGEFMIGQTWEAMETLSFYRLDSVIAYVDANGQSADGKIDEVMGIEPLKERLEAFGAVAVEVDGHDVEALAAAAETPHEGRPLVVIARTNPYCGVEVLAERAPKFHYIRFAGPEEKEALERFYVRKWGGRE